MNAHRNDYDPRGDVFSITEAQRGDKVPPWNLEAERGVLGASMIDNEMIDEIIQIATPDMFYRDSHQILARTMFAMRENGLGIDTITLEEELRTAGVLEEVGGLDYLYRLHECPCVANATYWANIVHQKWVLREAIRISHETIERAYSGNYNCGDVMDVWGAEFADLSARSAISKTPTFQDSVAYSLVAMDRRLAGESPGIGTGFPHTDAMVGEMKPGQMVVVGARPSMGKTAYGLQVLRNVVVRTKRPGIFVSLEMSHAQLANRLLSLCSGIDGKLLANPFGRMDDEQRGRIEVAAAHLLDFPFVWAGRSGMTIAEIAAEVRTAVKKVGPAAFIVVDYIQLVKPENPKEQDHQSIGRISKALKALAGEQGCPVMVLSQLNRSLEGRDVKSPRLSDLRGSGSIEEDADMVIMLHRPDYYDRHNRPGEAEYIIAKNRDGETGIVKGWYEKPITRFSEMADQ